MRRRHRSRLFDEAKRWLLVGLGLLACEPKLLLGELVGIAGGASGAATSGGATGTGGAGGDASGAMGDAAGNDTSGAAGESAAGAPGACATEAPGIINDAPLQAPWQTSFEDGVCGFLDGGLCYMLAQGRYRIVKSPVRTGTFAAAFDIDVEGEGISQVRCARGGQLPSEAYYGAWYYLPEAASDPNNWNLFHFRGGDPGGPLHGLWDVSLTTLPNGELAAYVRDQLSTRIHEQADPVAVPIGRWFHLEFYLKRAADTSGEVALFQDGVAVLRLTRIRTDDSEFAHWYVGNYAVGLTPPQFTAYVDDVTVRLGP